MNIEAIMFANRAAVENGLLAVAGGAWEHYDVALFPATISGWVAGVLTLDEDQRGSLPALGLEIFDDEGHVEGSRASMIASGTRPETVAGVPCREAFAIPFMTVASGPTVVKARLSEDGNELAVIAFAVRGGAPDAPPEDLE